MFLYTIIILLLCFLAWLIGREGDRKNSNLNAVEDKTKANKGNTIRILSGNTGRVTLNSYLADVKVFYITEFNRVPAVRSVNNIDMMKAHAYLAETFQNEISYVHEHCNFNVAGQKTLPVKTVFIMNGDRMIELANDNCRLLHGPEYYNWADKVLAKLAEYRIAVTPKQVMDFAQHVEMN